jgi:hypothetical protein
MRASVVRFGFTLPRSIFDKPAALSFSALAICIRESPFWLRHSKTIFASSSRSVFAGVLGIRSTLRLPRIRVKSFFNFFNWCTMHSVEEKKVPLSLKVSPQLKAGLHQFAKRERRPIGNLAEVILEWAFERLVQAGDSIALLRQAPEGTRTVGLTSHISEQARHVTKEQLITDRVEMGAEIVHGAKGAKKKTHRSKAS